MSCLSMLPVTQALTLGQPLGFMVLTCQPVNGPAEQMSCGFFPEKSSLFLAITLPLLGMGSLKDLALAKGRTALWVPAGQSQETVHVFCHFGGFLDSTN